MKKVGLLAALFLMLSVNAGFASDDDYRQHHMMDDNSMHYGYGMMEGYGPMMGHGMRQPGWGGCSPMMGPGMMGYGRPGGMGMMAGRGCMGPCGMVGPGSLGAGEYQQFMDETVKLRRKMHDLHFEYLEAARNPKTTLEKLGNMEQEMLDLRKRMLKKVDEYRAR